MLRLLTAGESNGRGQVGILEGLPAGVPISPKEIAGELARGRSGRGRSRQTPEGDPVLIMSGVRHGRTLGSPIALTIDGAVWGEQDGVPEGERERASATRIALGVPCKAFLAELGVQVLSHVVRIGLVGRRSSRAPRAEDLDAVDASPVRCLDRGAESRMIEEIDRVRKAGETVGGIFEVLAYGCPPGLGSHVQFDRKLDARLALVLMSIPSVKRVEVGDGFATAARPGSRAHDEILEPLRRATARAGGIEGGMSTGQSIRVRAAMKPVPTDVCAVPASAVVGEAVVAHVLADAALEKFGGDSLAETRRNLDAFVAGLP